MTKSMVQKLKDLADKQGLVLKIFCDNAKLYYYNAKNTHVSFDMTNEVFYGIYINVDNFTSIGNPVQLDVVEFEMIQGITIQMTEDQLGTAITDLAIPDIDINKVKEFIEGDKLNRFGFGKDPYLYNNSTDARNIKTSVATPAKAE